MNNMVLKQKNRDAHGVCRPSTDEKYKFLVISSNVSAYALRNPERSRRVEWRIRRVVRCEKIFLFFHLIDFTALHSNFTFFFQL